MYAHYSLSAQAVYVELKSFSELIRSDQRKARYVLIEEMIHYYSSSYTETESSSGFMNFDFNFRDPLSFNNGIFLWELDDKFEPDTVHGIHEGKHKIIATENLAHLVQHLIAITIKKKIVANSLICIETDDIYYILNAQFLNILFTRLFEKNETLAELFFDVLKSGKFENLDKLITRIESISFTGGNLATRAKLVLFLKKIGDVEFRISTIV